MRKTGFSKLFVSILCAVALACPGYVRAAASPQVCTVSESCSIGEFLYDDSYSPITTGTCTFTSRYPDGTIYLNATPLTSTADGWYAHEFTTPTTEGVYRSQICCTADSDYLCIDKSFEARAQSNLTQSDVSDAVWNAQRTSHATSGTFGAAIQRVTPSTTDIASAVWGYSGRTLSSFGSLVTNIWSRSTRTLTGESLSSGSLATKSDVESVSTSTSIDSKTLKQIEKNTKETRLLIEKQVNKPVIENSIEDSADAQTKIKTTQEKAKNMYFVLAQTHKSLIKLQNSWASLPRDIRLEEVQRLMEVVGEPTDKQNKNTLFGTTNWFVSHWDYRFGKTASKNVSDLYTQLKQTQGLLVSRSIRTVYFPQAAVNSSVLLKMNVGEIGDEGGDMSLFSEINDTVQFMADVQVHSEKVAHSLKSWKSMSQMKKQKEVTTLTRDVLALNRIPQINSIVNPLGNRTSDKMMHNRVLFLSGLLKANTSHIAQNADKSFSSSWLELGSIVFKTLVTNPSTLITQDADVKYYLPKEVKKEDILNIDEGLTLKLDAEKAQYYVVGTFELEPGESRILSVRVNDIWVVSDKEIASLKKQAESLVKPLEKTSYFAQGVTFQSDIESTLDKIKLRQDQAETPEAKLVAYNEAQIDLKGVNTKMDKLKELVTQSSSTGSLFGFVGATQTLAVWGLIIIISAGFIFLTIYMRKLSELPGGKITKPQPEPQPAPQAPTPAPAQQIQEVEKPVHHQKSRTNEVNALVLALMMVSGVTLILGTSLPVDSKSPVPNTVSAPKMVLGATTSQSTPEQWCQSDGTTQPLIADMPAVEPTQGPELPEVEQTEIATITETPTGWLRVRNAPSGSEVTKVDVGQSFPLIEKGESWFKIQLEDSTTGWVSSTYVSIASSDEPSVN
jgi:Bacterial SH3 domain